MGTTPATPALKAIRFLSESLNFSIQNTQSEEIRSDRTETDLVQTDADVAGDINFEMSFGTFDDFLQAVLCGTWTSVSGNIQSLTNGTTLRAHTIQKHFTDTTPNQYHTYKGCVLNGMNMSFETGQIVTGAFSMMGWTVASATSQIAGATFPAASTTSPMNAVTNFQSFNIDAVPYSGCISALSMSLTNGIRATKCVGSLGPRDMILGTLEVTGSMDLYFKDGTLYDKFIGGTEFDFSFRMVDNAGNSYTFSVPRAKFETGEVVAGGRNTDVMFKANWRGLYDGTAGYVIKITKDPIG
jgi:hypothetical protein